MALSLLASLCLLAQPVAAAEPAGNSARVRELIEQLGHPAYAQRRDARRRLESIGLAAFDDLRVATKHPDPEIADASTRLLGTVLATWEWRGDSPAVRRWLDGYGKGLIEDRLACVAGLSRLARGAGAAALVRIARFDSSELVSRTAAASLLTSEEFVADSIRERAVIDAIDRMQSDHGVGSRVSAQWLDLALRQPAEASVEWGEHASELTRSAGEYEASVNEKLVAVLRWRQLRAALRESSAASARGAIDELIGLDNEPSGRALARAIRWASQGGTEAIANGLAAAYADRMQDKRGLYRLAELAARFGHDEEAQRLANEALDAEATYEGGRAETLFGPQQLVARDLRRHGFDAWAIAEYEAAIAGAPETAEDDIDASWAVATWRLADLYFDAARYEESLAAIKPLVERVASSAAMRERYEKLPQVQYGNDVLPRPSTLFSQERLCAALAAREAGDSRAEMNALRGALAKDRENADVVIAMYRVREPTDSFKKQTREAFLRMRQTFDRQIWDWEESKRRGDESYSSSAVGLYNQWAWLVSNTEGDFDKAVRYSQRSLEFRPDTASCLDTLGRCYFSAGRIEEAIETQRRAVELQPWMEVMRRQLEEFESARENRTSSGNEAANQVGGDQVQ